MEKLIRRIIDHFFKEKFSVFAKWATGGGIGMWVLLFNSAFNNENLWYAYIVKVFGIAVSAFFSGFIGVLGTDAANWVKSLIKNYKIKRYERRQRKAEKTNKAA